MIPLFAAQIWVVVGEEFGLRGFALPRLQRLIGSLPAALVIGVLWAAWHLPMFFVPGAPQHGQSFWEFCYVITAWSIIMTALYNIAGASLIPTMLFHAASNGWGFVFNLPAATRPIELALYLPVVAVAVVALRTRGRGRNASSRRGTRGASRIEQFAKAPKAMFEGGRVEGGHAADEP